MILSAEELSTLDLTRCSVNIIMTGVGYGGWTGWGISVGYFLIDSAWGDEIWNKIEKMK